MGTLANTERDLWDRAVSGDPAAFGEVFSLHADRVFGHSLRLTRSRVDADDVTAITFLHAWNKRTKVRIVDDSIIGWLLVTAGNIAHNLERSRRRERAALARLAAIDGSRAESSTDGFEASDTRAMILGAFEQLAPRHQEVLALCVIAGLPMAETASALGVPIGTVKSRLARAKSRLHEKLPARTSANGFLIEEHI
jgi:RNA polymerase sigma-70 factor (ECF subfamily)